MRQPVLVLDTGSRIPGLVMGYDAAGHEWPDSFAREWDALEAASPGMGGRAEVYERVSAAHKPAAAYFYLGVIGVDSALQGQGIGARLLAEFCALSDADSRSTGVYLETGTPANLPFYERHGFAVRGEGDLDGTPLWCLFRAAAR
jgi:GNAT superfamily N-acetyltransferase